MTNSPFSLPPSSASPDSQPPLSLNPRAPGTSLAPGVVEQVGAQTVGWYRTLRGLVAMLVAAINSNFVPGKAAAEVARGITVRQVFFTGFEALPLVSVVAALVGATIILQTQLVAAALPGEILEQILVAVVLREMAPLITAVVVAGRSGTAIATELGNMKANDETLGLASLGIDPMRIIVWPRLAGTVVSVLVLTVYFGGIAIMSGYLISLTMGISTLGDFQGSFGDALTPWDLPLFFVKGVGLGTIVGWLCCYFGMEVQGSPTEVPQRASQAVVMSLLACVVYNTMVTAIFYYIVGPPGR
ncbi:MAG TPA: ABC transporter permease [Polyangiaceae bacterium]|nr:ABC transporter permease [Polyangiaceae bacterium]